MTNQENGVDLKSAAVTEEKKLFIETYGCHTESLIIIGFRH